ncbi:MAG: hypothetical protein JNK89_06125 [Saprospiraceae bacterium]|nr:hypothetical protein [Saprospiraceae bacterium]
MKRVFVADLTDLSVLSDVLDQCIYRLSCSPLEYRASALSRDTGIHASILTRMKLLHVNPQYEIAVSRYLMIKVLNYLQERFPTLVFWKNSEGEIVVKLYKKFGGRRLGIPQEAESAELLYRRNPPKPGSTRWYLEQLEQPAANG